MAAMCPHTRMNRKPTDSHPDGCPACQYSSFTKNDIAYDKNYVAYDENYIVYGGNDYRSAFTYDPLLTDCYFPGSSEQPLSWPSYILEYFMVYVCKLFAFILFPVTVFLFMKRVHAFERLVVFRLGRQLPIKGPGFVFLIPFVDSWTKVDLNPMFLSVTIPQALTVDGGIVEVTAGIRYQVCDVMSYVTKSSDPVKSVQDLSTYSLTNTVTGKYQEELEKNREVISEILKKELNETLVKWGVEIISISLNPVKILKAAEPVSAISTLMGALKAVAEQSNHPFYAGMINEIQGNLSESPAKKLKSLDPEVTEERSHIVSVLEHFVTSAANKEKTKNIFAIIKMEIICSAPKTVHITVSDGNISVCETIESEQNPDISVALSESTLQDILSGKKNAVETYFEGKITITGNLSLLNTLSDLLN